MNIQKALVVDDSKVAHLTLRKLLVERNIEVDWVGSGEEAVSYIQKQKPDIIFMDVMMPGMDGFETTQTITNNAGDGSPPIIMCSANATDEDKDNAKQCGATGFLSKPYTPAQMDQILQMVRSIQPVTPEVVEEPLIVEPVIEEPMPIEPVVAIEEPASVVMEPERVAEPGTAVAVEELVRKIAAEVARTTAEQIIRTLGEEMSRKAARSAVQAAQEAAKKVASDVAWNTATEAAQVSATKAAKAVAEQAARTVGENVAQQSAEHALVTAREDLLKSLGQEVLREVQETLGHHMGSDDFKQRLRQIGKETILPMAQAAAQETAVEAAQQIVTPLEDVGKRANLALIVGVIGVLIAGGAIILHFL